MSVSDTRSASLLAGNWSFTVAAVTVGAGLLLCLNLSRVPLLDADEPRFAECSRQMLVTGDWMYPQFNGEPRHAKPPLFNWIQATCFRLGGVSEVTARLPSVFATLGTGLLLAFGARRWRGPVLGLLALVTWFSLPQTQLWGGMSVVDPLLTLFISAALLTAFLGAETPGGARWNWYLPCGLALGFAVLTKGPVGLAVPAAGYGVYLLLSGQLRKGLLDAAPWVAFLIALAVAAPWFAAQIAHYGKEYTHSFFGADNFRRYLHGLGSAPAAGKPHHALNPLAWLWPIPVVLLFAFPASILLPRALKCALRGLRAAREGDRDARWRLFLAAWLLTDAVLFAPSATRLPQYFMALYPPAALLVADLLLQLLQGEGEVRRRPWPIAAGFVGVGLLVSGGFTYAGLHVAELAPKAFLDNVPLMAAVTWLLVAAFAVAGVWCAAAWVRGGARATVVSVWAMGLLPALVISKGVWPAVGAARDQGIKELGLICRQAMAPEAPVVTYGLHTSTIVFYSHRLCLEVQERTPAAAMDLLRTHADSWLLTRDRFFGDLPQEDLEILGQRHQYLLARLRLSPSRASPPAAAPR